MTPYAVEMTTPSSISLRQAKKENLVVAKKEGKSARDKCITMQLCALTGERHIK
jgi:hypothetical protein